MYNKWSKENIISFINNNSDYTFIDFIVFDNIKSIIKLNCKHHGDFEAKFANIKSNIDRNRCSCKLCVKEKMSEHFKTPYNDVKKYVESRGYSLLSKEYNNNREKIHLYCNTCDHDFYMSLSNFKKQNCPNCAQFNRSDKNRHSLSYIKSFIENTGEYKLISNEYINAHQKLSIHCLYHNYTFNKSFHDFQQGQKCPKCGKEKTADKLRHSYQYVNNYIASKNNKLLSLTYKNNEELLDIQCENGHEFQMSFGNFVSGHRCPKCNISSGESEIKRVLDCLNLNYFREHKFSDCTDKQPLRFDFYIPMYNICIEFDGKQHYEPIEFFGGESALLDRQYKDILKNEYCENNDIRLLRIPYWKINEIEQIIKENLNL